MAFLRGGTWGNVTARARRVGADLVLAFSLVAFPFLVFPLLALDCCTVDPLFPLVCVAFERCASRDVSKGCAGNREMDKEIRQRIRVRGHSRN